MFENSLGAEFTKEDLAKIYDEGKIRYALNTPPGYKDSENKKKLGDNHVYGDLIIWKELIKFSKKEGKPLIFVTDDRKEDWWKIENGKTIRPREELIKEFYELTGVRILIYNADNFLKFAKERKLIPNLSNNTIKEVKETRISDEKFNDLVLKDLIPKTNQIDIDSFLKSLTNQNNSFITHSTDKGMSGVFDFLKVQKDNLFPTEFASKNEVLNYLTTPLNTFKDIDLSNVNVISPNSDLLGINNFAGKLSASEEKTKN